LQVRDTPWVLSILALIRPTLLRLLLRPAPKLELLVLARGAGIIVRGRALSLGLLAVVLLLRVGVAGVLLLVAGHAMRR